MGNMQPPTRWAGNTALRRNILLVVHDGRHVECELNGVLVCAIQMIVDEESNEGKGGDTKGREKLEGVILEDSRMWVEGREMKKSDVDGTVWLGLVWTCVLFESSAWHA